MRFPIAMTAGMAGYILKNKMRSRPEWQKTAAREANLDNPFRILPAGTGAKRQPHPMINKRFPIVLMIIVGFRQIQRNPPAIFVFGIKLKVLRCKALGPGNVSGS